MQVMNIKLDDPETITQIPALKALVARYQSQGLRAILVPTDQGDYEPDDSATVPEPQTPNPNSQTLNSRLETPEPRPDTPCETVTVKGQTSLEGSRFGSKIAH